MPSIRDIYPDTYLRPEHLRGRKVCVVIKTTYVDQFWNSRTGQKEPALVVRMEGKKLPFILNKTQTFAIAAIADSEDYTQWVGTQISLEAGEQRGKTTILVSTPEGGRPQPQPSVQHPDAELEIDETLEHPDHDNGTNHPDEDAE